MLQSRRSQRVGHDLVTEQQNESESHSVVGPGQDTGLRAVPCRPCRPHAGTCFENAEKAAQGRCEEAGDDFNFTAGWVGATLRE